MASANYENVEGQGPEFFNFLKRYKKGTFQNLVGGQFLNERKKKYIFQSLEKRKIVF